MPIVGSKMDQFWINFGSTGEPGEPLGRLHVALSGAFWGASAFDNALMTKGSSHVQGLQPRGMRHLISAACGASLMPWIAPTGAATLPCSKMCGRSLRAGLRSSVGLLEPCGCVFLRVCGMLCGMLVNTPKAPTNYVKCCLTCESKNLEFPRGFCCDPESISKRILKWVMVVDASVSRIFGSTDSHGRKVCH